jgi:hypothetical protein
VTTQIYNILQTQKQTVLVFHFDEEDSKGQMNNFVMQKTPTPKLRGQ